MRKNNGKEDGYFTVELTMIFPVIFFSTIMILFMGIVLYQQVNLQSLAVRTAQRGSVIYASRVQDMKTGKKTLKDFEDRDPYRYVPLLDDGTKKSYIGLMNRYVAENIGDYNLITGKDYGNQYVTVHDYLIEKRIVVNIRKEYHVPVDGIAEMFGSDGIFNIDTSAAAAVTDPVEFMRNVDLCTDVFQQTSAYDKANGGIEKINEYIAKYQDLLKMTN